MVAAKEAKVAQLKKTVVQMESQKKLDNAKVSQLKEYLAQLNKKEEELKDKISVITSPPENDIGKKSARKNTYVSPANNHPNQKENKPGDFRRRSRIDMSSSEKHISKVDRKLGGHIGGLINKLSPAAWYRKKYMVDNLVGISPILRRDELCTRKPYDKSQASNTSTFFTSTPSGDKWDFR